MSHRRTWEQCAEQAGVCSAVVVVVAVERWQQKCGCVITGIVEALGRAVRPKSRASVSI